MAQLAHISEQSVRNYTRRYGALLSPSARGEVGPRIFSDSDIQVLCTIAALLREGVPAAEVIARVSGGDIVIDATPTPQQATPESHHAIEPTQSLMLVRSDLQGQINALRRTQTILLRAALLWGMMLGAIAALALGGFVLWVLWLLAR